MYKLSIRLAKGKDLIAARKIVNRKILDEPSLAFFTLNPKILLPIDVFR
jgi:hypothetical protein